MKKVSIITPTYNHEKFIDKCITSVTKQNYSNWEQIIIEDASTDNTLKIVKKYSEIEERIKIILHKKNWGIKKLPAIYNQALKISRGKYIAILEGDDFWPKDKLEKQIDLMEKTNAVLSYGDCIITNHSGIPINLLSYNQNKKFLNNSPIGSILNLYLGLDFSIIPATIIIRKNFLQKLGGFQRDNYYPFTDLPTILALSKFGKFAYLNDICGYYRKQQDSSWFLFASTTDSMGKTAVKNCVNNFLDENVHTKKFRKIYKNINSVATIQNSYLNRKRLLRKLSIFINKVAFKGGLSPFTLLFAFQYFAYKLKRH